MDGVEVLELWGTDEVEYLFEVAVEETLNLEEFEIRHGGNYGYPGTVGEELAFVDRQRFDSFVVVKEGQKLVWVENGRSSRF